MSTVSSQSPSLPTQPPLSGKKIQQIFNRIAPVYDQFNDWLSLGQHRIWKRMTIKWSEVSPGDTCLDLCCGTGDLTLLLAEEVGNTGQVFGVDFSLELLARARLRPGKQKAITWVEGDALDLPFPDAYFDCATIGYGLRNITDIPRCLQQLHRVLKPGAKAAILDFHRPNFCVARGFQQWYLDNIVVPLAKANDLYDEYAYISPSLDRFPIGREQVEIARWAGFAAATHYPIAEGTMGVLVVTKG